MLEATHLDAAFAALAHPTRRAILARLAEGDATVNALAEPFEMSLPAISRHIRVLEKAGLITRSKTAQFRPCSLNPTVLEEVARWTDQYRTIWEARFSKMEDILNNGKDQPDE